MNLYLNNQKRDRDLNEYMEKLCVELSDFIHLNQRENHLLLIGGGCSLQKFHFKTDTIMKITNVDLLPPYSADDEVRLINLKADFLKTEYINTFDEIWALYSLPLYSQSVTAAYLFVYKTILSVKSHGCIRFFPLEFNSVNKMCTKDADYDITTDELNLSVLDALSIVESIGIKVSKQELWNNQKGTEETVILKVNFSQEKKNKINSYLLRKISELCSNKKHLGNINVYSN